MNYKMMGRINALILGIMAVFMLPPLIICCAEHDTNGAKSFLLTIVMSLLIAGVLALLSIGAKRDFYAREGLISVGLIWILISLLGCLPFYFSGQIPKFIDALFETVSGFTTTGASVVNDVEKLTKGMLYWRSFTHWVGGMGVLVFLLALIPISGKNEGFTMHLLRAESPGPDVGKLVPKMRHTAAILYITYLVLTLLAFIVYVIGGMPVFEAVCNAFGTAGTGGFGVKNDSFASYSPFLQNACTVFMLLFGVNFSCYFLLIMGHFKNVFKDDELKLYLGIVLTSAALITVNIRTLYETLGETVRHAFFQVATVITTTGFSTADFDAWPAFSKGILLCLMIIGACAGSTGGGLKCARVLLLIKGINRNIAQILRPRKVQAVRVNGKAIDEKIIANTNAYFATYIVILVISFLIVSLDEFSITTNFSSVIACLNNIGPGFDSVGPTHTYAAFSPISKIVLIIDMLAGRLEIFPILVLFFPSSWRKR